LQATGHISFVHTFHPTQQQQHAGRTQVGGQKTKSKQTQKNSKNSALFCSLLFFGFQGAGCVLPAAQTHRIPHIYVWDLHLYTAAKTTTTKVKIVFLV